MHMVRDVTRLWHACKMSMYWDAGAYAGSVVKIDVEKDADRDPFDSQTVALKGIILTGTATCVVEMPQVDEPYGARGVGEHPMISVSPALENAFLWDAVGADLKKKAEAGNADSQYNLGLCYANGLGIGKNLTEAVKWYQLAANQGDGRGTEANLAEAYYWPYLSDALEVTAKALTADKLQQMKTKADQWLQTRK
jgi:TPR repeat protein